MHLSVIIPAYNESKTLKEKVSEYNQYLSAQNYDYEIIIVNDGSLDDTAEISKCLENEISRIRLIDNQINRGKGAAVKQGFQNATGNYQLFLDADGATSINHLDKVWEHFQNGADLVIGTRNSLDADGAWQKIKQPFWKRSLGKFGNIIIQTLSVPGIWDTQCGFKIFKAEAINNIIPQQTVNRWAFDVELLVIARKKKLNIAKIPVVWKNSNLSRVGLRGYFTSLKEILKIFLNKISGKYN